MLIWAVDEPDEEDGDGEAKGAARLMAGSWLIDFRTNDSKTLIAGELREGIPISAPPVREIVSSLVSTAPFPAPSTGVVSDHVLAEKSSLNGEHHPPPARGGTSKKGAGGGVLVNGFAMKKKRQALSRQHSEAAVKEGSAYRSEEVRGANEHLQDASFAELAIELVPAERETEQVPRELDDILHREKKPMVDVAIQTDTFFPLVITRPSSPIFLPSSPTDVLPAERIEADELRGALFSFHLFPVLATDLPSETGRLSTIRDDLAAEQALPKTHVPTSALPFPQPALQIRNRLNPPAKGVEPFKPLLPRLLFALAQKTKRLLIEAGKMGKLEEENTKLRRQLQSFGGPARPSSAVALSRLDLGRLSDRTAFVVNCLVGQLRETRAALRESKEENGLTRFLPLRPAFELLMSLVSG
ncbi:hypothetical protein JCM10213_004392 [Rhodosporidiobolus nylandii]